MKVQKIPWSVVSVQNMEKTCSGNPELGTKQEKKKKKAREKRVERENLGRYCLFTGSA